MAKPVTIWLVVNERGNPVKGFYRGIAYTRKEAIENATCNLYRYEAEEAWAILHGWGYRVAKLKGEIV